MGYDANFIRQDLSALFDLKGDWAELEAWCGAALPAQPASPNNLTREKDRELMFIGPRRYLLRAPIKDEAELEMALRPAEAPPQISVVRVSDTLTFFSLVGAQASELVQIASTIDARPAVFAENSVTYTSIFGLKGMVLRTSDGFEIAVEQSFADMVEEYLTRALR